jgi:phosphoribosyl 1,2-cyclic phosphodiesterase
VFDLGTGFRVWGTTLPSDGSFRATAVVTHLHLDHVQGLAFCEPLDRPGAVLDIYGPAQEEATLQESFEHLLGPPYFPVHLADMRGTIRFHEVTSGDVTVGRAKVRARPVPHLGPTVGYRVERDGVVVAYLSDHQAPRDCLTVGDTVLELCEGADLLIHDAQYTAAEWAPKSHWGHCTVDYAVMVASTARVRRLVLYHHDPARTDDELDQLVKEANESAAHAGVEQVIAAAEGMTLTVDPR